MIEGTAGFKNWIIVFLLLAASSVAAQNTRVNSPYTLFGIGHLNNTNTNVRSMSMGGIKYGLRNPTLVNAANPASYTAFDTLSFVFEGAVSSGIVTLKSINQSEQSNYASLNYLTFGFPITHWWRSSFGILPYSHVGYEVAQDDIIEDVGLIRYINDGSGGFNSVYWGHGFRIFKNLSVGFNAEYVFGTIDNGLSVMFPDSAYYFSTRKDISYEASDFVFTYGLQYTIPFKNNLDLTLGATYANTTKLHAKRDYLARNFYGEVNDVRYYKDTISYQNDEKGDIIIPKGLGAGFILEKKNKWLVGADVNWQNWKEFKSFGVSDSLENRLSISVGAQFIPERYSIFSYFERMSYRVGFRYTDSYLHLHGHKLTEFGISFGLGFPLWKSRSTFNVGIEVGKWGTTVDGLIQENFIRFNLSMSVLENWFIKPKYQ